MARLAGKARRAGRPVWLLLSAATPGRWEFALRQATICAAVTWVVQYYQTPEAALTAYVVFFLNASDRATSVVTNIALTLVLTLVIALVVIVAMLVIDDPMLRVASMAAISFGLLFLASASRLSPIAATLALIAGYALGLLGDVPGGETATRALLYAWLFVGIPAGVSLLVNLLAAPSPRRLVERELAARLRLCAAMLRGADGGTRARFAAALAQLPGKPPAWTKMAALERTSPAADVRALDWACTSSVALMLCVEVLCRGGESMLPARAAAVARTLDEMARIFGAGGYPLDVMPPPRDGPSPSQAAAWDELDAVIARFAEPAACPPAGREPARRSGFLRPDACSDPGHVRYALKTTAAAMACYALYQLLDWPGIHTCFLTCYIVALPTAAETVEKLALRIAGCLAGATAGIAAMVFVLPLTTSVEGLIAIVFTGAFASAWVAGGGPKIAYAGFQVAFAFFLCVMQGAAPAFDLTVARDRVIGIVLGNLVTYLVFTRVWPVSVAARIDPAIAALLRQLSQLTIAASSAGRRRAAAMVLAAGAALARDLELARYEPSPLRPSAHWLRQRRALVRQARVAVGPMLIAAEQSPGPGAPFAGRLDRMARAMSGGAYEAAPEAARIGHAAWSAGDRALRAIERRIPRNGKMDEKRNDEAG